MTKEKNVKSIHGYQDYMDAYYQEQKKKGDRKTPKEKTSQIERGEIK